MNTTTPMGMLQQPRPFFMIFLSSYGSDSATTACRAYWRFSSLNSLGSRKAGFVTFGAFAALVYGLISIGGYVGDHLLGTKRTIVLGALVLAIGYFMTGMSLLKPDLIFIALGLSLSVTACLKLTQPACFRNAIRRKIHGLMAHSPCSICRSISAR